MTVWISDELAEQARAAGLNVSALTRTALRDELARWSIDAWLATLPAPRGIDRDAAAAALKEARADFGQA